MRDENKVGNINGIVLFIMILLTVSEVSYLIYGI